MSRKIGIITLISHTNYGNRLQNYATQELLKKFNYDPITIEYNYNMPLKVKITKLFLFLFYLKEGGWNKKYERMKDLVEAHLINKLKKKKPNNEECEKKQVFNKFNKKYMNIKKTSTKELTKDAKNYDFFITGSDQVWNPPSDPIRFLTFTNKKKRIAFSTSFGVTKIPGHNKKEFKKNISNMKCLSVREYEGAEIIKELTGREAKVLIDPTLVLTKDKWEDISAEVKNKPKKYIFCFMFGSISKKENLFIDKIAKEKNLEILKINDLNEWKKYKCGPQEFIDLIKSAEIVFTNSYHGTIFSIIFSKPFVIFKRHDKKGETNMNSRFKTLSKKFDLKNRFFENIEENNLFNMSFSNTHNKIEKERKKTYSYLRGCLNEK